MTRTMVVDVRYEVLLRHRDGVLTYKGVARQAEMNPSQDRVDVMSLGMPVRTLMSSENLGVTLRGIMPDEGSDSPALRLALAVLRGDADAALALADLVAETFTGDKGAGIRELVEAAARDAAGDMRRRTARALEEMAAPDDLTGRTTTRAIATVLGLPLLPDGVNPACASPPVAPWSPTSPPSP